VKSFAVLALFLAVSLGGGFFMGVSNPPGAWYAGLNQPWFQPPNWLFAPAWTILYVCIGIAGWRVWRAGLRPALVAWAVQMAFNLCWSPLFFGWHLTFAALLVLLCMLAAILAFIATTWRTERPAALLFLPYAAWVSFAGLLNGAIWWLN
jgi:benzodiazapine receptor